MPLPDADKKSPRVYTNLQNLDLDNVTFANIQATGNPIAVEEMNEDEMRRLVLVNLARLVTAGEWTGLLEAGGGGGGFTGELTKYNWDGDGDAIRIFAQGPWGTIARALNQQVLQNDEIVLVPFIASTTGTISQVDLYVGTTDSGATGALDVGFYSDNEGVPETFLGEFVLDTTTSGQVTQTSSSEDIETVRGTQYWVGLYADNFDSTPTFMVMEAGETASGPIQVAEYGSVSIGNTIFKASAGGNATITDYTSFSPGPAVNVVNIGVKW